MSRLLSRAKGIRTKGWGLEVQEEEGRVKYIESPEKDRPGLDPYAKARSGQNERKRQFLRKRLRWTRI